MILVDNDKPRIEPTISLVEKRRWGERGLVEIAAGLFTPQGRRSSCLVQRQAMCSVQVAFTGADYHTTPERTFENLLLPLMAALQNGARPARL